MNDTEPFEAFLRDQAKKSEAKSKAGTPLCAYWAGRAEAFNIAADALQHFRETGDLLV